MNLICFEKLFVSVMNIWSSSTLPFCTFYPRTWENCSVLHVWYLKVSLCSSDDFKIAVVQRNKYSASQPWTYSSKGKLRVLVIKSTLHHSVKKNTSNKCFINFIVILLYLVLGNSYYEILRWVKSSVLSQAAMSFQWIKPGGPPGLKYLRRTLNIILPFHFFFNFFAHPFILLPWKGIICCVLRKHSSFFKWNSAICLSCSKCHHLGLVYM